MLARHVVFLAASFARAKTGKRMDARIATIEMTTRRSISVKPAQILLGRDISCLYELDGRARVLISILAEILIQVVGGQYPWPLGVLRWAGHGSTARGLGEGR